MPQMPTCPKCGEPIEFYTETLCGVTVTTTMVRDSRYGRYVDDMSEQDGGHATYACGACRRTLDEKPEPIEEAAP